MYEDTVMAMLNFPVWQLSFLCKIRTCLPSSLSSLLLVFHLLLPQAIPVLPRPTHEGNNNNEEEEHAHAHEEEHEEDGNDEDSNDERQANQDSDDRHNKERRKTAQETSSTSLGP
jgi:hypothetical protein